MVSWIPHPTPRAPPPRAPEGGRGLRTTGRHRRPVDGREYNLGSRVGLDPSLFRRRHDVTSTRASYRTRHGVMAHTCSVLMLLFWNIRFYLFLSLDAAAFGAIASSGIRPLWTRTSKSKAILSFQARTFDRFPLLCRNPDDSSDDASDDASDSSGRAIPSPRVPTACRWVSGVCEPGGTVRWRAFTHALQLSPLLRYTALSLWWIHPFGPI